MEESDRDCHRDNLCQQQSAEAEEDGARLVVDGMNAYKMNNWSFVLE